MKRWLFVYVWALTTLVFTARLLVEAEEAGDRQPQQAAATSGTVVVNGCTVTAEIIPATNGIEVAFSANNPFEDNRTVELFYAVQCMDSQSPYARMMVMPQVRQTGTLALAPTAGATARQTILVKRWDGLVPAKDPTAWWAVVVSQNEIRGPVVGGAAAPVVAQGTSALDGGYAVLAALSVPAVDIVLKNAIAASSETGK